MSAREIGSAVRSKEQKLTLAMEFEGQRVANATGGASGDQHRLLSRFRAHFDAWCCCGGGAEGNE